MSLTEPSVKLTSPSRRLASFQAELASLQMKLGYFSLQFTSLSTRQQAGLVSAQLKGEVEDFGESGV
ncbi:MAG: hypothetical protein HC769_25800 [Cyanobacteria bacterium CRU_2_1]|nr:hypothetical protein [Cyanobacteria bacterium RU_5_0]NJR61942.1 hypothetical protein [Cyanobacteria bacterium CRU_2_1]